MNLWKSSPVPDQSDLGTKSWTQNRKREKICIKSGVWQILCRNRFWDKLQMRRKASLQILRWTCIMMCFSGCIYQNINIVETYSTIVIYNSKFLIYIAELIIKKSQLSLRQINNINSFLWYFLCAARDIYLQTDVWFSQNMAHHQKTMDFFNFSWQKKIMDVYYYLWQRFWKKT